MLLIFCIVLVLGALAFTLLIRPSDLPPPQPVLPWQHLDERKARIYENLRDLQFEFRVGKLSDEDYQSTKQSLQRELAKTLSEIDELKAKGPAAGSSSATATAAGATSKKKVQAARQYVCPHCKASFDKAMKFCGECGKAMEA